MKARRLLGRLLLAGLGVCAFSLAAWLEPWFQSWAGSRTRSANLLQVALGDGRKLFARHFFAKADAYFHAGFYPSIFKARSEEASPHRAAAEPAHAALREASHAHAEGHDDWRGPPKDWLDRFSRRFQPARHRHLGEAGGDAGEARELLPWLRVAASLDPDMPETYLVAAYWLRARLGRWAEAEQFLREGLRHNPGHPEMLLELGRVALEHRRDPARARNLWELALRRWHEQHADATAPDNFLRGQILGQLARLEEQAQNYSRALSHLRELHEVSPHKAAIKKWAEEIEAKLAP